MKATALLITALGASLFFGASDSWVYVHSGVSITNGSPVNVKALKQALDGDFFWFTSGGRSYVVRDAASLQLVREIYAPLLALPQSELAARIDSLNASTEKKLAALAGELVRTGNARLAP
jgi:hypothetical protein